MLRQIVPLTNAICTLLSNYLRNFSKINVNQGEVAHDKQNEIHFSQYFSTMSILRNCTVFMQKCSYQQNFLVLLPNTDVK